MRHANQRRSKQVGNARRYELLLLQFKMYGEVQRRPQSVFAQARFISAESDLDWKSTDRPRRDLHVPHASRSSPNRAGQLSNLRHGARTAFSDRRRRYLRTAGHDAAFLGQRCTLATVTRDHHERVYSRFEFAPYAERGRLQLAAGPVGNARGAVGRLAVLRPRLGVV